MTTRRQFLNLAAGALATPALPSLARGQSWPARSIRADGAVLGRQLARYRRAHRARSARRASSASRSWSRTAAARAERSAPRMVAKADPDGYTILINASAHSSAPAAYPNIPYDPARDFSAVIPFGTIPNVAVISPEKGIKTIQELVAAAKAGSFTYASAGVGSATHWAAERLRVSAGFQALHVPFRGGPEALIEVMAGRVDFTCMGMSAALPLHSRRQAHPAGRELAEAIVRAAGRADDAGGGPRRIPTTLTGWGCSCRRRRRPTSSSGSIRKLRKRCNCPA